MKAEEAREARRLEAKKEMRLPEAEEKVRVLEAEELKMYERKETKKIRIFELEKTRIEVNSLRGLRRGVKENTIERW